MAISVAPRDVTSEPERAGSTPVVSVVIPTRHEAATIGAFLYRTFRALGDLPTEVIVVDDSDRDNTVEVLEALRQEIGSSLIVVHRPKGSVPERTLGTAVVTGIRVASGEYVCVMDADGQHPPETIPEMIETAQRTGADYVGGSRYLPGGSAEGLDGVTRQLVSRGLAVAARSTFLFTPVRHVTDPLSGFFLFQRRLVDHVELRPVGWKISLEVLVRGSARQPIEVPYTFARRADGESKATIGQGLLVLRHFAVLLFGLAGFRRLITFGAVGLSGVAVNMGILLTLDALGFDGLSWPIWVATEAAIVWNYFLNKRVTWRDRPRSSLWSYNASAACTSLISVLATMALAAWGQAPLWLAAALGIVFGMAINYLVADLVIFTDVGLWSRVPRRLDLSASDL